MGDQGFFLGEHGLYDKRWMYEEALQMPCLISYPNAIKKGQDLEELTLNIDIAPTLLDFAGVRIPDDIQGESMKGLLTGKTGVKDNWRNPPIINTSNIPNGIMYNLIMEYVRINLN